MIDAAALKATAIASLTGLIGTYTFSGGQTTPAIRIEDGADPYTEEPVVTGLEVVIQPELEIQPENLLGGDRRIDLTSAIVLKQWDIATTTKAAREILLRDLDIESVAIVPRNARLDNIEVCTLTLSHSFHLL